MTVATIQVRRDTAANWTSVNPTLASGEFGYETDTAKLKLGNGATAWTSLGYITSSVLTDILARWTPASSSGPASLALAEDTDNGTNKATLIAPASMAADRTITLPDATGTLVTLAGGTFTGDISVPDEAYDATAWNGSLEVPTKNAVRDKIESLGAGGGALTRITETVLGSAAGSISFTSIPGSYRSLTVVFNGRSDRAANPDDDILLRFNGDSGGNYDVQRDISNNTGATNVGGVAGTSIPIGSLPAATAPANNSAALEILVPNYVGTTFYKSLLARNSYATSTAAGGQYHWSTGGQWRSTSAITQLDLICSAGQFVTGTVATLYGMG